MAWVLTLMMVFWLPFISAKFGSIILTRAVTVSSFERYQRAYEILCDPSRRRAERELERARLRRTFGTSPATSSSSYTDTDASAGHAASYTTSSNTRVRPRDWGHEGTEAFLPLKVGFAIVAALAVVGLSTRGPACSSRPRLIAAVQFMLELPPIVPLGLVGVAVTILTLIVVSKKNPVSDRRLRGLRGPERLQPLVSVRASLIWREGWRGGEGRRDPADWLPTRKTDRCRYVQVWVGVKHRWGLSMDKREQAAVDRALQGCKIKKRN